ncbi:lysylphosphatidylglycerol synthase domain-containing protein [Egibacter rhizosphaerae]|uniref:lysylphosphatidylglycerol synthase domain-containing protein n=1 Tax=Egibacter rhizosphaerae TaxID=1670831 RepID=UPI0013F16C17|nr:lysylphosphatidylglycerol synthase domain-containing protein [Egibacter rhizosphaerae]
MTGRPARRWRLWLARATAAVVNTAVVGWLLLVVLPEVGDLPEAGELLREQVGARDVSLLAGLMVLHVVTFAGILLAALPSVRFLPALGIRLLTGGMSKVLPLGPALAAGTLGALLHRRGFSADVASRTVVVTGVWNLVTKLALPVVGVVAVLVSGAGGEGRPVLVVLGATAGLLLTLLVIRLLLTDGVARVLARLLRRPVDLFGRMVRRAPPEDLLSWLLAFQEATATALRTRWASLAGWSLAHHATHVVLLWVALHVVAGTGGPQANGAQVLAVMSIGYLLTGLPIAPGGLGALDVVVVAGLGLAGEDPGVATAAVALYRLATYAVYAPSVALAWPVWRHLNRRTGEASSAAADAVQAPRAG